MSGFELSSLTLLIGVVVATCVRRFTGVNPGGLIAVPMLILAAQTSLAWALCIPLVALLLSRIYTRFFGHVFAGKTPMFILAFMSVTVMVLIGTLLEFIGLIQPDGLTYPLGIILPGILANSILKQGFGRTVMAGSLAIGISLAVLAVVYQGSLLAGYDFFKLDVLLEDRQVAHEPWSGALYLVSIAVGYAIYRRTGVKSAGYIMLAFLANLVILSPLNFLLILALAGIVYLLTGLIRRYTMIIGLGRYALVFALSIVSVWTTEYVLLHTTRTFSPFLGTSIIASLVIAVLVNEHTINGFRRASPLLLVGTGAMTLVVSAVELVTP